MPGSASHRINRLRLAVRVPAADKAFPVRAQLAQAWESMLPAFNQAFDGCVQDDQWLHIPRLELRLVLPKLPDSASAWQAMIGEQLQGQLREHLAEIGRSQTAVGRQQHTLPDRGSHPVTDGAHGHFAILQTYLQEGRLPWYAMGVWDHPDTMRMLASDHAEALHALAAQPQPMIFYFRLLTLLTVGDRLRLGEAVGAHVAASERRQALMALYRAVLTEELPATEPVRHAWAAHVLHVLSSGLDLRAFAQNADPALTMPVERQAVWQAWLDAHAPELVAQVEAIELVPVSATDTASAAAEKARIQPDNGAAPVLEAARQMAATQSMSSTEEASSGRMVPFAGLILLHSFIPSCLAACGITDASQRIPVLHLPRAAALLHFLASGGQDIHEYQLGLVKLLLGLAPDTPLAVCPGLLMEEDMAEANHLLEAVIGHWRALKKTSTGVLRTTFLQRSGVLRPTETGWQLRVERSGVDVLLVHLPWSVSWIKLPWMAQALAVEW